MASYTIPLFYSPTVLIAPRPGVDNSLAAQTVKVLAPFEPWVWALILLVIVVTAILSVWFSGESRKRIRQVRRMSSAGGADGDRGGAGGRRIGGSKRIMARLALDACLRTGTWFCSAGVEQDSGGSLPSKILLLGFSLFTLVVVSAYVANLAAFLTRNHFEYVGTMGEVMERGWRVCALPATREELEVAWPDVKFVWNKVGNSYHGLLEEYDAGKCQGERGRIAALFV